MTDYECDAPGRDYLLNANHFPHHPHSLLLLLLATLRVLLQAALRCTLSTPASSTPSFGRWCGAPAAAAGAAREATAAATTTRVGSRRLAAAWHDGRGREVGMGRPWQLHRRLRLFLSLVVVDCAHTHCIVSSHICI